MKLCAYSNAINCSMIDLFSKFSIYLFGILSFIYLIYFYYKRGVDRLLVLTFTILAFLLFQKTSPEYRKIFLMLPIFLILLKCNDEKFKLLLILLIFCTFPKNISLNLFFENLPNELFIGYFLDPILLLVTFIYTLILIPSKQC